VLIPIIDALRGAFSHEIIPSDQLTGIQRFVRNVVFGIEAISSAFKGNGVTSDGFIGQMERIGVVLRKVVDAMKPVFDFVQDHLKPILIGLGIAFLAITAPVTTAIAALVLLYAKFAPFRDVVNFVIGQIENLVAAFSTRFSAIQEAVGHVMNAIRDVIVIVLAPIIVIWQTWGDQIMAIVGIVFDQIKLIIDTAVRIIRDIIDVVLNVINGNWGAAWDALKDIPAAILTYVVGTIEHILGVMKQIVSGGIEAVVGFFRELPGRLGALAGSIGSAALGIGKAIIEGIGKGLSAAVGFAGDVASSVLKAIKNVINTQVIDRINSGIPDSLGAGPFKVNLPKNPVPRLAAGAIVDPRPGGVLANIAEGGRTEGVFPLPPGVLEGLQAIAANYRNGKSGDGGPLVGQIVFEGAVTADAAESNAAALIRRLRAEAWVQGK
jgi:phage-related protein